MSLECAQGLSTISLADDASLQQRNKSYWNVFKLEHYVIWHICLVVYIDVLYVKHRCFIFCFSNLTITVGDAVYVVGTPFGSLSPTVFLNSISKGVLSNIAGAHHELLLTDARCMPGTEGGAIYAQHWQHDSLPVGIVVAPLCWKANEWIGLSLGCQLSSVLNSLESVLDLRLKRGISKSNPV